MSVNLTAAVQMAIAVAAIKSRLMRCSFYPMH